MGVRLIRLAWRSVDSLADRTDVSTAIAKVNHIDRSRQTTGASPRRPFGAVSPSRECGGRVGGVAAAPEKTQQIPCSASANSLFRARGNSLLWRRAEVGIPGRRRWASTRRPGKFRCGLKRLDGGLGRAGGARCGGAERALLLWKEAEQGITGAGDRRCGPANRSAVGREAFFSCRRGCSGGEACQGRGPSIGTSPLRGARRARP